ncbi:MAG: DUF262 domain-containing protein [Salinivirgaceae bacterium]
MSANLQIHTRVRRLVHYIEDIERGLIKIPDFQRDFVWEKKDKLDLFDSIKRGYPIGSILFWKPLEQFSSRSKFGPYYIDKSNSNEFFYILDGFQRLSTIFGCLLNPSKTFLRYDEEEWAKKYRILYDLEKDEFIIPRGNQVEPYQIPLYHLIDTFEFLSFSQKLQNLLQNQDEVIKYIDKAKNLATTLVDYSLPSIDIIGGEIQEAVEIFSRINSKGLTISSDWMVSALTSFIDSNFRLGSLIDDLLIELENFNFNKLKRDIIFQCIQNSFGKVYFDTKIEELVKRKDFIPKTRTTLSSIYKAVKFLFEDLLVLESRLLPYNTQLIFITDFFNKIENPSDEQLHKLKDWFWVTTYSNYFTIYSLSKQREAYYQFQKFLRSEIDNPVFNDKPNLKFEVVEFPGKILFGSVRAKALVLFLLNHGNNFNSVNAEHVRGCNIQYLYKSNQIPASVIPTIEFISEFSENNLINGKLKELSVLFDMKSFKTFANRYFLNEELQMLHNKEDFDLLLVKRKFIISEAEAVFTKTLGLDYDYTLDPEFNPF